MGRKKKRTTATGPSEALVASLERHRGRGVPMAKVAELVPWIENPRDNAKAVPAVVASLQKFGWTNPVLYRADGRMVEAGHTRLLAAAHLGLTEVPAIALDHDERSARLYALADNRLNELAGWTPDVAGLMGQFDAQELALAGWEDPAQWLSASFGEPGDPPAPNSWAPGGGEQGSLQRRFGAPPVSVLDARSGYWVDRKLAWIDLGLRSWEGREALKNSTVAPGSLNRMKAEGGSIFDPVLAELLVRWFCPQGGLVLDPFAGGSVRGVISAACGRQYLGIDLRADQVAANVAQWAAMAPRLPAVAAGPAVQEPDYTPELTPVERHETGWLKRDDLFTVAGVRGGKVRSCWRLAHGATGLVTAGSRSSPQVNIVAHIAHRLGVPCRVHTPSGEASPEVQAAVDLGAERVTHVPGHNSVIIARAREDAAARGWTDIPFGMECQAAVDANRGQVANLPGDVNRLVVPVGSGMTLAGILWGLKDVGRKLPILGVVVGADPEKRLDKWAPPDWRSMVELVPAGVPYDQHVEAKVGGVVLDPVYEAKAARFLEPGDCLWCVGIRQTVAQAADVQPVDVAAPQWVTGDSLAVVPALEVEADMILSCPPYADLEVYSDDPADLSNMAYDQFLVVYRQIIAATVAKLKPNRWIGWVVGEVRNPKTGIYRNFVADTVQAFIDAGASYYNEAILVTGLGSIPIRAGRQFESGRKLGKTHQNVLVFVKGDFKAATEAVGPVDFGALPDTEEEVDGEP